MSVSMFGEGVNEQEEERKIVERKRARSQNTHYNMYPKRPGALHGFGGGVPPESPRDPDKLKNCGRYREA